MELKLTSETTEEEFKAYVRGASDTELAAVMSDGEVRPELLARIFAIWCDGVIPKKTRRVDTVVRWQIGEVPDVWDMHIRHGRCDAQGERTSARPAVTMTITDVAFLRMVARQSKGLVLVASGQLRIDGNMLTATRLDGWFS
jgi:alkyl sulfatase BDS1-like metallo-beta-lactamase superfamily hydrolase